MVEAGAVVENAVYCSTRLLCHTFVIDTSTLDNLITGAHAVLVGIVARDAVLRLLRAAPFVWLGEGKEGLEGGWGV